MFKILRTDSFDLFGFQNLIRGRGSVAWGDEIVDEPEVELRSGEIVGGQVLGIPSSGSPRVSLVFSQGT